MGSHTDHSDDQRSPRPRKYRAELSFDPRAESYCTTAQFARLDDGRYHKHCGPTAITNLILTLQREETLQRERQSHPAQRACESGEKGGEFSAEDPEQIFRKVARSGARHLAYWNTDRFRFWGGTSDFLAPAYVHLCLKENGLSYFHVRGPFPATRSSMGRALMEGKILYLEVHGRSKYGNHHMLCYGYARDREGRLCWKVADGWAAVPVYLPVREVRLGMFLTVS